MPRVTCNQQYQRHQRMRELQLSDSLALARLDARTQVVVTWFYEPDRDHTPESLRVRRQEVARTDPSPPSELDAPPRRK